MKLNSLQCAPLSGFFPAARFAITAILFVSARILRGVCVSVAATSNTDPMNATASHVLKGSNDFQMGRINAASNAAEMVDLHSFWNLPFEYLVGNPMGDKKPSGIALFDLGVSAKCATSSPEPAPRVWFRGNFIHESLKKWKPVRILVSHVIPPESLWSGLLGASNAVAARSYFPIQFAAVQA